MLQTCLWITTGGGQGIFYINIYTYCMYTIKLKALILSIVFNYQCFLMKIDCTKCLFFILLLVHVVARTDELYGWYTKYSQQLLFILRCKKTKKIKGIVAVIVCCPSRMHKLNICNSDFVSGFPSPLEVWGHLHIHRKFSLIQTLTWFKEKFYFYLNYPEQFKHTNKIETGNFLQKKVVYSRKSA